MAYDFDPSSDEAQALQLLAMSIKPTKVERIGPRSIRWTFGVTITESGDEELTYGMAIDDRLLTIPRADYPPEILAVDQSYNVDKTLEESPNETKTLPRVLYPDVL